MKKSWTILTGKSGKEALQARVQDLQVITQVGTFKALITLHRFPLNCIVLLEVLLMFILSTETVAHISHFINSSRETCMNKKTKDSNALIHRCNLYPSSQTIP